MNPAKSLLKSVLLLLLSLLFPICVSLDTITLDQPIKDGQTLVSNQKTFALGFFSPGNSNRRYVGIWYYQITEQTIVWVANRDNPLNDSSGILSINSHGNLVLHTQNQTLPIWSTNIASVSSTNYSISIAQLLDVGNLVLVQQHSQRVLWQSFDYPTNTILPFMKVGLDQQTGLSRYLTSWKSPDDPKIGKYSFKLDPIGYPQLLLYKGRTPLWRGGTWSSQGLAGVPEMKSKLYISLVNVSFVNNQDEITIMYSIIEPNDYSKIIFVLGESGTFGMYTWGNGKWVKLWYPKESCDIYLQCGPNSYCDPYNGDEFDCTCLPGFEPKSPLDWHIRDGSSGCVRNQGVSTCKSEEGFVKLASVKVPDTSVAHVDMSLSLKECEQECLRNCSCTAYTSADESEEGIGCLTWHGDLVDIRTFSNGGQDLYIRVDSVVLVSSTNYSISIAQLLDVGNLVLVQQHSQRVLWQSFDYPTNTILPFMKVGLDQQTGLSRYLTSWKSPDDPKIGKYSFKLDPIGYPQLLLYKGRTPLWRGGTWSSQGLAGVPEMKSKLYISLVNVSFVNNQDEITIMYSIIEPNDYSKIIFVLGESGTFGMYTWGNGKWVKLWYPKESCDIYLQCGPNSYCDPYNGDEFDCTCLPGFEPKSPLDWHIRDGSSGCVRNQGVSTCKSEEGFVKLASVKVPDTSVAHVDMSLSLKECEQECLRNCSCTAYTSADESEEGIGCLTWHGDLVDIRTFSNGGQDLYIRVDSVVLGKRQSTDSYESSACSLPNFEDSTSRRDHDGTGRDSNLPVFDLKNIIAATDNFSVANLLGKGGFGSVYKTLIFLMKQKGPG
nr:g-type lectin s-receptor-like serine/threonine-protein kinase [Quercus suber]